MRDAEDKANLERAAEATQRLYSQTFGSEPAGAAAYCGAIRADQSAYCGAIREDGPAYCGAVRNDTLNVSVRPGL